MLAFARELRDRWVERVREEPLLPGATRYDVTRQIAGEPARRRLAA